MSLPSLTAVYLTAAVPLTKLAAVVLTFPVFVVIVTKKLPGILTVFPSCVLDKSIVTSTLSLT